MVQFEKIAAFLNAKVDQYNRADFIQGDPISVPHLFSKQQDIEIAGFFASIFAWGNRTTIIQKSKELMELMDNAPHDFLLSHQPTDLKKLIEFKHRTFNTTDLLYFVEFLKAHYTVHDSLESAFIPGISLDKTSNKSTIHSRDLHIKDCLVHFHHYFFSLDDIPERTRKHVATPERNSTCKRLNMFLRWMVRKDNKGVDFGIWKRIAPANLICPIDLHVARVARQLKIIERKQTDWLTAVELTDFLKMLDPADPVKYDFALFSLGVEEGWGV